MKKAFNRRAKPKNEKIEALEKKISKFKEVSKAREEKLNVSLKKAMRDAAKAERNKDTRLKAIAGGLILKHIDIRSETPLAKEFYRLLDEYVEERDRGLFDLPAKKQSGKSDGKIAVVRKTNTMKTNMAR